MRLRFSFLLDMVNMPHSTPCCARVHLAVMDICWTICRSTIETGFFLQKGQFTMKTATVEPVHNIWIPTCILLCVQPFHAWSTVWRFLGSGIHVHMHVGGQVVGHTNFTTWVVIHSRMISNYITSDVGVANVLNNTMIPGVWCVAKIRMWVANSGRPLHPPVLTACVICILQAITKWRPQGPENEATELL